MITFLHHNLNEYDVNLLEKIMDKTKYPAYEILDIKELERFSLDDRNPDNVILVYDETKSKSTFEKTMDKIFTDDTWSEQIKTRIPKPSTFIRDKEEVDKVWKIVSKKCNLRVSSLNSDLIPSSVGSYYKQIAEAKNKNSCIILKTENNEEVEIRPDNFKPSNPNSLTYTEFVVLMAAKYVFEFDKIEVKTYE